MGALLDSLKAKGLLDNTVVIVAADHGEQLGERGLIEHGNSLYWPLLHVSLLLFSPLSLAASLRVAQPVSVTDVCATIQDLVSAAHAERVAAVHRSRHCGQAVRKRRHWCVPR